MIAHNKTTNLLYNEKGYLAMPKSLIYEYMALNSSTGFVTYRTPKLSIKEPNDWGELNQVKSQQNNVIKGYIIKTSRQIKENIQQYKP